MNTEIYIQVRMDSMRLPGKALKEIAGKSLLEILIERLRRVTKASTACVLTTINAVDGPIIALCQKLQIPFFRGSQKDVLGRYYACALERKPDRIVRITADCPLMDPAIVDEVITVFSQEVDYVSNTMARTFPRGMDVEVFSVAALERAHLQAKSDSEREHVTLYMYRHPEQFRLRNVSLAKDLSFLRLTVDTQEDFDTVKNIFYNLYPQNPFFTLQDIIEAVVQHPDWIVNKNIQQKQVVDGTT